MSLIVPKWGWQQCTTNMSGTPGTGTGTTVTAGANNADGTSVVLISALAHDCEYLIIGASGFTDDVSNTNTLLDILIDPAGGTTWASAPIINDLLAGYTIGGASAYAYHFPLWIKSGSSIGARARTARVATQAGKVVAMAFGNPSRPAQWWCGAQVQSIGITAASSKGTNHTAGNSGAYSAWTDMGSTLTYPCGALQFGMQGTSGSMNNLFYYFEFGVGSTRIGQNFYKSTSSDFESYMGPSSTIFATLPAGAQLQVRGTCSGTAQAIDVAAYAVQ